MTTRSRQATAAESLAARVQLSWLPAAMRKDLVTSIQTARRAGVRLPSTGGPEAVYRAAVAAAISAVERRGGELKRFLSVGPRTSEKRLPGQRARPAISDRDTRRAINFIYSHVVISFQGALAELLALGPLVELTRALQRERVMPLVARLVVGDAAMVPSRRGPLRKGADAHWMVIPKARSEPIQLCGLAEIKSYHESRTVMSRQVDQHRRRLSQGVVLTGSGDNGRRKVDRSGPIHRVTVLPAAWLLSRSFRLVTSGESRKLVVARRAPPAPKAACDQVGKLTIAMTLRWSREAIAEVAFELALWYMGELGTVLYQAARPAGAEGMTPHAAGRNAVKQQLYYAIRRCPWRSRVEERAIKLYNSFSYGYPLGMNFRGPNGRLGMLCPGDLDEIAQDGKTRDGGAIWLGQGHRRIKSKWTAPLQRQADR